MNIDIPYNVSEFANLMNRVIVSGLVIAEKDNYDDYDELALEVDSNGIKLTINFYSSGYGDETGKKKQAAYDRLKAARRVIGGRWEKDYRYSTMAFVQDYFGGKIELTTSREAACRKVVVSVEEIPEEIVPKRVIPARTKENVEWICDD